jgi:hypothetical protein
MGLALAVYHIIQSVALVGVNDSEDPRAVIQTGFWPIKLLALVGLTIGCMFLPRWLLDWSFYPTLAFGVLFLIIQAVLLVDLAYSWAEALQDRAAEGKKAAGFILVGATVVLNLMAVAVVVAIYIYFERNLERTLITINGVLIIIMSICSVIPIVQDANPSSGLFQSSLLGIYSLFVILSAFVTDPTRPKGPNSTVIVYPTLGKIISVLSVIYAYLAVARSALSTGSNLHRMVPDTEKALDEDSDQAAGQYNYSLFHVSFAMAAFYTTLYVTFWQYSAVEKGAVVVLDSWGGYWSRVISSWVITGFYIWSLFAPIILEDRSF